MSRQCVFLRQSLVLCCLSFSQQTWKWLKGALRWFDTAVLTKGWLFSLYKQLYNVFCGSIGALPSVKRKKTWWCHRGQNAGITNWRCDVWKVLTFSQAGLLAAFQTAWNSKQFSPPTRKGTIASTQKLEFLLVNSNPSTQAHEKPVVWHYKNGSTRWESRRMR